MAKKVVTHKEVTRSLEQQRALFVQKFGRESPRDPLLFDPDCDVPTAISEVKDSTTA